MASRARKSPALPVKQNAVTFSYIFELPGAEFIDDAIDNEDNIEYATRMQQIQSAYEYDGCQEMLWHDCQKMGFSSAEIREFVRNPAAITNCRYMSAKAAATIYAVR
jgi:hypothetical protein